MNPRTDHRPGLRRRDVFGLAAAASVPVLSACSSSSSEAGSTEDLTFWDMPWGGTQYTRTAEDLVNSYPAPSGLAGAQYQGLQWANYYQTFSSAIASDTGPAVSSGGGFQAFQFAQQGAIHYADDLIGTLRENGTYDDFLPGTMDAMQTGSGYAAVPWQIDIRVLTVRRSLLEEAGTEVPTDWASFLEAGRALQRIGVAGYGTATGAGANIGSQGVVSFMINNGGGFFNEQGEPDCVTDRNIESLEFFNQMAAEGIINPRAVAYTTGNLDDDWQNRRVGMGITVPSLASGLGESGDDLQVISPLASPNGDKGTLYYINNLMMYQNTPSEEASEAFLRWYLDNMSTYWTEGVIESIPVRQSIVDTPEYQSDANKVRAANEWQPVGKTLAARGEEVFAELNAVDGGQDLITFAQRAIQGQTDPRANLEAMQAAIESVV
ncbi:ABC transporter substrate-binding protein [Kineococcus sp. TBRC 1896]|uniref:ABC transporter substrate-binding protein n=1 Tax=Kineococcus mangrovi TaxID=1660183 RepID=A0ABV4I7J9_9ACTN